LALDGLALDFPEPEPEPPPPPPPFPEPLPLDGAPELFGVDDLGELDFGPHDPLIEPLEDPEPDPEPDDPDEQLVWLFFGF